MYTGYFNNLARVQYHGQITTGCKIAVKPVCQRASSASVRGGDLALALAHIIFIIR